MLKKSPSQGFIYESVTPSRWSLNLIKKDRSTASNRITALHAHISEGSVRHKDLRAAWCDLLRTNVILPHKILCSEILHIIPNRNNLSTATLQQEVTSRCGVESSALAAAQHPLSLIMSRQSCVFLRVCFCSNTAASLVVTPVSALSEANGHYVMFSWKHKVSAEQLELLKHWGEYVGSFPPSPRASSLTLLSITPNPTRSVHSRAVLVRKARLFIVKHDL